MLHEPELAVHKDDLERWGRGDERSRPLIRSAGAVTHVTVGSVGIREVPCYLCPRPKNPRKVRGVSGNGGWDMLIDEIEVGKDYRKGQVRVRAIIEELTEEEEEVKDA